ncbi:Kinesin- protein 12 [Rhizophlyctis rosea]|nr:Kinesin- protein 12 [Rhizophlyctis rosea]
MVGEGISGGDVVVRLSYLEVYNEMVQDLLSTTITSLPVRHTHERGFYVDDLIEVDCKTLDDAMGVLDEGLRNRTTRSHKLNEYSSRSHSILTVTIETPLESGEGKKVGMMKFVDLAGSERIKQSDTKGETLAETLKINKSLLTLGNVISTLSRPPNSTTPPPHIPYRDSKLTMLLRDSLGGTSHTLLLACISPSSFHESLKTLRYASRAMGVVNRPVVGVRKAGVEEEVKTLRGEVGRLREENGWLWGVVNGEGGGGGGGGSGGGGGGGHAGGVGRMESFREDGWIGSGMPWMPGGGGGAPPYPQQHPSPHAPPIQHQPPHHPPLHGRRSTSFSQQHAPQPQHQHHPPPPFRAPSYTATLSYTPTTPSVPSPSAHHTPHHLSRSSSSSRTPISLQTPRDVSRSRSILLKDVEDLDREIWRMEGRV